MMRSSVKTLLFALLVACIAACGGRTAAWDAKGERPDRDMTLLNEAALLGSEGDAFWRERWNEESVRDAIVRWQQAVIIDPSDHELYTRLSNAHAVLATDYLSEDVEEREDAAEEGVTAAETALMLISPEFGERMGRGADLAEGMEVLGPESAGALFWYAVNLDAWLDHQTRLVRMRRQSDVEQAIERVLEIDETYDHGAVHRYLGQRYAGEGELAKAEEHLRRALEISPDYLLTRVLLAEKVAVGRGDQEMFEEQIGLVLEAEDTVLPDHQVETQHAKSRARELLAGAEDLF